MSTLRITPGAAAQGAFRLGLLSAAVAALALIGLLYWLGELTLPLVGYTLVLLFPVYLVVVASALSVWLGFDKDARDLRPVYVNERSD